MRLLPRTYLELRGTPQGVFFVLYGLGGPSGFCSQAPLLPAQGRLLSKGG